MKRKKSEGRRLLCTMLTVTIVLSIFTVGILPVGADGDGKVASVTRDLPDYILPSETFAVTLTQSGFLITGWVWEVLPEGFEYVNGSYTGGWPEGVTYYPDTRTLKMPFYDETVIAYSVRASSYDQTAEFSGMYRALVSDPYPEDGAISGDTKVGVDGTPPYTDEKNPAKDATDVPVDTNIVVHVKDNYEVNPSTITMTVKGSPVSPTKVPVPGMNDWLVTYNPPVNFGYGEVVTVTIDAADKAGNAMTTDAYSFTTEGAPAPDTTAPTWNTTVGIQSATDTGNGGEVTVTYGTATDAASPPVKYNVYYSTTSPATGGTKLSNVGTSPYTVTGLTNGQLYYFSVRVEDSAATPNEDTNTVQLTATPTAVADHPWDINGDGEVDDLDLGLLLIHYGETTVPPYPGWDINEDGFVDDLDLGLLLIHYGEVYP